MFGRQLDWFLEPLAENSPLFIFLDGWMPTVITIVLGGFFASILFPRIQDRYIARRATYERQQTLREDVASQLHRYAINWRRLIDVSSHQRRLSDENQPIEHLDQRKEALVEARNEARDALWDTLSRYQTLVAEDNADKITDFLNWDEAQSSKILDQLPNPEEWFLWQKVLTKL